MKALTTIVQDTRRALKNGNYPIKLRVTYDRKQKYYSTDINLSISEFNVTQGNNPKGKFKMYKMRLNAWEQKANQIIDQMTVFDFAIFNNKLYNDQLVRDDVYEYYSRLINSYHQKGSIGTAINYSCSFSSLRKFKKKLTFFDVTVNFLEAYEQSLLGKVNQFQL